MIKSIYIGNLPVDATEVDLHQLFAKHGTVVSLMVIKDRETGISRGFGFVDMEEEAADNAMERLDGIDFFGHPIRVMEPLGGFSNSIH